MTDSEAAYRQYVPLVRRVLSRRGVRAAELDDAMHDVFITVHRLLPEFEGRAQLATWIHAIAWRSAAGYLRRAYRQREVSGMIEDATHDAAPAGPAGIDDLHASLALLAPEDRDLLALHEVGGLSIAELSELTGSARATISQRIERAKAKLSRKLSRVPSAPAVVEATEAYSPQHGQTASRVSMRYQEGPGHCFSRVGDTVLALWRGPFAVGAMRVVTEMLLQTAEEARNGVTFMSLIEGNSRAPDREGREVLGWAAAQMRDKLRAVAFVPETPAMRALAVPIVNTAVFLSRSMLNLRFFGEVTEATQWVARYAVVSSTSLIAETHAMRLRLDRRRAAMLSASAQAARVS